MDRNTGATDKHRGVQAASEALFVRARQGDGEAYWQLVEPVLPKLYRGAVAMCGNRSDAEDVTQEALLLGWQAIGRLQDPARLAGWLSTIQMRVALRRNRPRAGTNWLALDQLLKNHAPKI